jgi:choline monooxygenase
VFRDNWVFAAFNHQLPNCGDMVPVEIAGQPVVIVRGDDMQLRAFHNVCRHRGAKLVDQIQHEKKSFVCPNHSWSYSLDGKLRARPHFFGGDKHDFNHASCHRSDLVEINCEVWFDWIFLNISGDAGPFSDHINIIEQRIEGYEFSVLKFSDKLEFDIKANWKLAIENFIEPYHVFSCHPWLNSFVGMEQRAAPEFQEHVLFCGYQFENTDPVRGEGLPYFPDLPQDKKKRGDWYVLFPNFAFEVFPDQVDVFIATPKSAHQCKETIALYFVGDGADNKKYQDARERVIIERMQAGRASEGFDGGVLSPYWDPVQQHFAKLMVEAMQ